MLTTPRTQALRRSVRAGFATLLAAMVLLVVGAGAAPFVAAVEPFRLPDQVTDQIGAVQGRRAELRSALAALEAEHDVRIWVVFVDSFDGVDPRAWADQAFTATGLGTDDYLLAVAMGDREYGYVVDDAFPLSDEALARVASAAERHLAENPAQAITEAARVVGDEITGRSVDPNELTAWVIIGSVMAVAVAFAVLLRWDARRVRAGQPSLFAWVSKVRLSPGRQDFFDDHDHWSDSGWGSSGGWGGGSSGGGGGTRGGSGSF